MTACAYIQYSQPGRCVQFAGAKADSARLAQPWRGFGVYRCGHEADGVSWEKRAGTMTSDKRAEQVGGGVFLIGLALLFMGQIGIVE